MVGMSIDPGVYVGRTTSNRFIVLRVQKGTGNAGHAPVYCVSGDVFAGEERHDFFLCSFHSLGNLPDGESIESDVIIEGSMEFVGNGWKPSSTRNGHLVISVATNHTRILTLSVHNGAGSAPEILQTNIEPRPGTTGVAYYLRTIHSEVDVLIRADLNNETQNALNDVVRQTFRSVQADFARQRVQVIDAPGSVSQVTNTIYWDEDDLYSMISGYSQLLSSSPRVGWNTYGLVVPQFRQSTSGGRTVGIMFDDGNRFDSAGHRDLDERQAYAVFWESIGETTGTVSYSQTTSQFKQVLRWAWVHEMGHTFNLIHPTIHVENDPSYMNYPDRYGQGRTAFLAGLDEKTFSDPELEWIQHGHYQKVVMGGLPFRDSDLDQVLATLQTPHRSSNVELGIRFRPERKAPLFPFGSPVCIEARLARSATGSTSLADNLDPSHGSTLYLIEKPNGQLHRYRPLTRRCNPGRFSQEEICYEVVLISHDAAGAIVDQPGPYRVQAKSRQGDLIVVSNVLEFWIQPPMKEQESIFYDVFNKDFGRYLSLWGSEAINMPNSVFEEWQDRARSRSGAWLRRHPMMLELARCRFYQSGRGRIEKQQGQWIRNNRPYDLELGENLLRQAPASNDPIAFRSPWIPNLRYAHLGGMMVAELCAAGERPKAQEISSLVWGQLRSPSRGASSSHLEPWLARWVSSVSQDGLKKWFQPAASVPRLRKGTTRSSKKKPIEKNSGGSNT
jgi:hypothetical protein